MMRKLSLVAQPRMSRPVSAVLLLLATILGLAAGCGDSSWREVAAADGGFRVLMRGAPRVEQRNLDTPMGRIAGNWYSLEQKDSVFGVGYADYPAPIVRATPPRAMFTTVREGWLKRIQGKPEGEGTDIKLDNKWYGMEFTARGRLEGREVWMLGRFYLVDNRLYQLIVFGDKAAIPRSDINKFMGSFKVAQPRELSTIKIDPVPDRKK